MGCTSGYGYVHFHLDGVEGSLVYAKTWAHDVRFLILSIFLHFDQGSRVQRHANYTERWNTILSDHFRRQFDEHPYLLCECIFVKNHRNAFSNVHHVSVSYKRPQGRGR